jgi:hypothetical protein
VSLVVLTVSENRGFGPGIHLCLVSNECFPAVVRELAGQVDLVGLSSCRVESLVAGSRKNTF